MSYLTAVFETVTVGDPHLDFAVLVRPVLPPVADLRDCWCEILSQMFGPDVAQHPIYIWSCEGAVGALDHLPSSGAEPHSTPKVVSSQV